MTTLSLIYFNAGGGHRSAALALEQVMRAQQRPWQVRLVNLTEVLDPQGLFHRLTGLQPEDIYNKRLASGFTLGLAQELRLLQAGIRLAHTAMVQRLRQHWLHTEPDLVVSLIPNFNRALCESLRQALPGVPYVTVLTDMADHPPSFWIEPAQPQHLICGTAHAQAQALAAGCDAARVHRVSGMILRPDFYGPAALDRTAELATERAAERAAELTTERAAERAAERQAVGLPAQQPTGIVLFGGHGSNAMKRIAQRLPEVPLILMCGRNRALAETLRAHSAAAPRVVVEFTPDVARWMALADFFIGKPGPGSLSEAVHMGLPVIVTRNAWTMPQERWNTDWVRQQGVGVVHRSFRSVRAAVAEILADLPALQERARRIDNRAVFEVPRILAQILDRSTCAPADSVPAQRAHAAHVGRPARR